MKPDELYQMAIESLKREYPAFLNYQPTVEPEKQQKVFAKLSACIPYEQFYFVLDMVKREIVNVKGIERWLCWSDKTFTFKQYFEILHPHFYASLMKLAQSSTQAAKEKKMKLGFMENGVVMLLALKHAKNEKFYLVKRTLYPFEIDAKGNVIAYLNHYVLIGEYQGLNVRVNDDNQLVSLDNQALLESQRDKLKNLEKLEKIKWTDAELELLKGIKEYPTLTNAQLSEKLGMSLASINKTHNRNILDKIRFAYEGVPFKKLKDVVRFLVIQGEL